MPALELLRSIPAPAGEPEVEASIKGQGRVYPRACGGTAFHSVLVPRRPGLSPRLRGNRGGGAPVHAQHRSIPAPAGEPPEEPSHARLYRVYPRACGGTVFFAVLWTHPDGLSPRLRGNQLGCRRHAGAGGSIPAPAGEPFGTNTALTSPTVYPRACGGTLIAPLLFYLFWGLSPRLRGNLFNRCDVGNYGRSIPAPAGEPDALAP